MRKKVPDRFSLHFQESWEMAEDIFNNMLVVICMSFYIHMCMQAKI